MDRNDRQNKEILRIENLGVSFLQYERKRTQRRELPVIKDLGVTVGAGELVAVVGSSGSGKSLLAHALFGLLPQNAAVKGRIYYGGDALDAKGIAALRGRELALIPQGVNYLDPLMPVGMQITNGRKDAVSRTRMRELCEHYGLEQSVEQLYPFELSGGMARRVLLMTALMSQPRLIVADEPTTGMDEGLARKVIADLREFADEGNGVLLITHDLKLALGAADRIVVFYAGTAVEEAAAADFMEEERLRHPYTKVLYRAMPEHGFAAHEGTQPYAGELSQGCAFAPRCAWRTDACTGDIPMCRVSGGYVKCVHYLEEEDQ